MLCTYVEALDFHDINGRRRLLPPVVNVVVVVALGAASESTFRNRSSDDRRWCHHDGKTWRYRVLLQQLVLVLVLLLPLVLRAAPQQCVTLMPGHVRPRWRIAISIVHRFLKKNAGGGRDELSFRPPQTGQKG